MEECKLLIHSAKQVVQVVKNGELVVRGSKMNDIAVFDGTGQQGGGVSLVIDSLGKILDIDYDDTVRIKYSETKFSEVINAHNMCILPGFVDAHTHPVWQGDRVHEFAMKLAGASYMDVHKAGGGIHFTVEHTKRASEDELLQSFLDRLNGMLSAGTTMTEAKSGYGLEAETEFKMLKVMERARSLSPVEISSTFCGAHAVPQGKTPTETTQDILETQLPQLKDQMDKGTFRVDNIDVFCEKGVFDLQQTRDILTKGRQMGLRMNFHGDELHPMKAAEMAAELQAECISHLEEVSEAGIKAMAKSGTIAVILPTTAYILRLKPPPVRKMIEKNLAVALGTDFNPNAFCLSMPLVMHLACVNLYMSMAEALTASTINAAASLGKSGTHGSIEIGKMADLIVIDAPRWEHIIYQMAEHRRLIKYVIKKGEVVHRNVQ